VLLQSRERRIAPRIVWWALPAGFVWTDILGPPQVSQAKVGGGGTVKKLVEYTYQHLQKKSVGNGTHDLLFILLAA
jgi:hypothetical protein